MTGNGYFTSTLDQWQKLIPEAKRMRRKPTPAEQALWARLRRDALGTHFRRQHPVSGYLPDFVCLARMLAVEVDGPVHDDQKDRDENRDGYLEYLGYRVLRFPNERALRDTDAVIQEIAAALHTQPHLKERS